MFAMTHQGFGCGGCVPRAQFGHIMGLAADGTAAAVTAAVADRVQRIRAKMITVGIPVAIGSGAVTMLTFAGAFGLARTERVWGPAIWLGAVTTVGGLISVALAAKTAEDAAKAAAADATTAAAAAKTAAAAAEAAAAAAAAATSRTAFGRY